MSDRHPGGRPPFTPTEQQRQTVEVLVAHGNGERVIAKVIGIDRKTLSKHFRDELRDGREMLTAHMGLAIVRAALAGDWRAAAYWLAIHCPAWRKPKHIAVSGSLHVTTADRPDMTAMSDEELRASIAELKRQEAALAEVHEVTLH